MPYTKPLPEWKNAGTKPPQSKIDSGWAIGDKPPAGWWNWWMYNTYYALQELQTNAIHTEKLGAASGVATLGADSKLTASQLPTIGSSQITDNSITNTDLATDIKVGSLAALTTTAKSTVVAAVNEVKSSADAKISNSEKGAASGVATLGADSKLTASQLPAIGSDQIMDGSITNSDLAADIKHGSNSLLKTANKVDAVTAINEIHDDFDAHVADVVKHVTATERNVWNAKAGTTPVTITVNGLMLATDKVKLNGISTGANKILNTANNGEISIDGVGTQVYTHPSTHPATMIIEDATHRFITDAEKATYAAKETPAGAQAKADAAEVEAKNASVPRNDTRVNSTDLNTYTTTQVTAIGSPVTNAPPGGFSYGSIMVAASATDRITQLAFDSGNKKLFVRYGTGSPLVWTSWIDLATSAVATASVAGLMSAADFTKLTGIATNANNYSHPTGDGNSHVPATGTTNAGKFLEAGATANSASWQFINWTDIVNKPSTYAPSVHGHAIADVTGLQTALDGKSATSHTHADATTTLSGFFAAVDKVKLNGISTGANKTTSSATNGNIAIDGSQVTVYTHPATHPATMIVEDSGHRFATDAEKNIWNAKASTAVATGSANGLMSAADFTKLAGVSTGANKVTNPSANGVIAIDGANTTVYTHPTGDGNSHVPATGTSNAGKFLKAAGTANSASWQPMTIADIISLQTKLDEPQKFKLTEDNGFTKNITTADLNYVLESGFYYGSDLANNPSGTSAFHRVWVMMSEPTSGVQLCMSNVGRFHMRFLVGGSWSDWIVVFTPNNIQTGSVSITPSAANTPTGLQVTFPKPFRKAPIVQVTALTTGAVASVTAASVTTTGFFIYLSRSSVIPTNLGWTAVDTEL